MPYYGFIIYFKLKRYARLEIPTSVINTIIQEKNPTSLTGGGIGFSSNFAFVRTFRKFLGCQVASCTVLF